ncbi:MAG: hypothetical protein ACLT33_12505 [Lachnospira pectinoschiza]
MLCRCLKRWQLPCGMAVVVTAVGSAGSNTSVKAAKEAKLKDWRDNYDITIAVAAVITTIIWYTNDKRSQLKLGTLALMYWGASLMWMVDAVVEYIELGAEYFTPASSDMLNDAFLGLSVVAFGLIIWIVILMVKDPLGVVRKTVLNK